MDIGVRIDTAEGVEDALVGGEVECFAEPLLFGQARDGAQQCSYGQFALAVDFDGEQIFIAGFKSEPGAPSWDQLGGEEATAGGGILVGGEVDAGGAHELANDDALSAVDDEGALFGHQGEIAHEDILLDDLAGFFIGQACLDGEGRGIGRVAVAALVLGIF